MNLKMLKSKIHRARVTEANVDYEGSITIDSGLMDAAGILPNECVHVWNVTKGSRIVTYAIPGSRWSGVVCVNGAGALLNFPNDIVIIATFCDISAEETKYHRPRIVSVGKENTSFSVST